MVCSTSPYAASIGARILAGGGNAVDAAIGTAAAEGVANAPMCGIGGDAVALVYNAERREAVAYDAIGIPPSAADAGVAVPGEVAMWELLQRDFGTRSFSALLEPAAALAEEGVPIAPKLGNLFLRDRAILQRTPALAAMFSDELGIIGPGRTARLPALGRSLRRIGSAGPQDFYHGELARQLSGDLRNANVQLTLEDLAAQRATSAAPLASRYGAYQLLETPPPSVGHRLLEIMAVLEQLQIAQVAAGSAELTHLIVEAIKIIEADPSSNVQARSTVERAVDRARSISRERAATIRPAAKEGGHSTSAFSVVDGDGNLVTYIHSLGNTFGAGIVSDTTGILMNNIVAHSLPSATSATRAINCWMVMNAGGPIALGGTLGGNFQVQGSAQVLVNLLDLGLDPVRAVEAPRVHVTTDRAMTRFLLRPEPSMPAAVVADLSHRGHELAEATVGFTHGLFQIIVLDPREHVRIGVSDVRGDGHPVIE
jgi:gamma-glutamyltranspeptidase / glutathione hydrolase